MSISLSMCSLSHPLLGEAMPLYRAEDVRAIDGYVTNVLDISGVRLMKRAGKSAFNIMLEKWPGTRKVIVLCGGGNNGGDGYVVAALAVQTGIEVKALSVVPTESLKGDAKLAYQYALQEGVDVQPFSTSAEIISDEESCVIVDALLGIGFSGDLRGNFVEAVSWANKERKAGSPVLSLDLPTGLNADTGYAESECISADVTVTFVALKQGLLTANATAKCGELVLSTLDIPEAAYGRVNSSATSITSKKLIAEGCIKPRKADAHKGEFGHVSLVGGNVGYGGAISLAGQAAARTGAGLTSVCTLPEHVPSILARFPEIMAVGVVSGQELEPYLVRPTVLVIGPGLGAGAWAEQMFQKSLATELPTVVDAEALTVLAEGKVLKQANRTNWVLTPHPGEAARLLNCSTEAIQRDRFTAARNIQRTYGGVVVLKGAGTVVADKSNVYLANVGNPGLASGGTGDVLSGVIGGLIAQGLSLIDAAKLGVCVHGEAADICAAESGQRGMLASDLIPNIRKILNS